MHTNTYARVLLLPFISHQRTLLVTIITCKVCSLVSVALLVIRNCSHPFCNLVRQILLGFSLGSKHMFTRFTHSQPLWYNSLTLWAYLAQRHDQQHREKLTHSAIRTSSHKNGRLHHVNTVHVLCTHTRIHVAE